MTTQTPTIPTPTHLEPSPLGTKEYWDTLYATELVNHAADPSDVGTIWFDDSSAEDKVLAFLRSPTLDLDRKTTTFLDVGTGNGHFLFRLREGEEDDESEEGEAADGEWTWRGRMMGTDYSANSIDFARRIAQNKGFGPGNENLLEVEFVYWDIMNDGPDDEVLNKSNRDGWDVVLDKGTFDAISLSKEKDEQGRRICERYKEKVVPLIRKGGLFLVTSCNWTEEELRDWFEGGELSYYDTISYKSFSFGGRKGQTISSVCFKRNIR